MASRRIHELVCVFGAGRSAEKRKRIELMEEGLFLAMEKAVSSQELYLNRNFTVDSLARAVGSNRLYVYRTLRSRGLRFIQYINTFRVQRAVVLLSDRANKDKSLDEIAMDCGFASDRTMNYYITKIFGVSSVVLRNRMSQSSKTRD